MGVKYGHAFYAHKGEMFLVCPWHVLACTCMSGSRGMLRCGDIWHARPRSLMHAQSSCILRAISSIAFKIQSEAKVYYVDSWCPLA